MRMTGKFLAVSFSIVTLALAQSVMRNAAGDWPTYNRDFASTRYSPLTQINPSNVSKLAVAWSYKMRADPNSPASGTMNEVTPIVVNGIVYLPAGNKIVAVDPDTGKEVWRYDLKSGVASQRGVAYWPGDKNNPPRILFLTGHKMVALNASTGKLDPGFGQEGEMTMDVPFAGVPLVYKNFIFAGGKILPARFLKAPEVALQQLRQAILFGRANRLSPTPFAFSAVVAYAFTHSHERGQRSASSHSPPEHLASSSPARATQTETP